MRCGNSYAAQQFIGLDMDRRESDLKRNDGPKKTLTVIKSAWLESDYVELC
jgi:hypothetical protein